jgi:hypothetical protein
MPTFIDEVDFSDLTHSQLYIDGIEASGWDEDP